MPRSTRFMGAMTAWYESSLSTGSTPGSASFPTMALGLRWHRSESDQKFSNTWCVLWVAISSESRDVMAHRLLLPAKFSLAVELQTGGQGIATDTKVSTTPSSNRFAL